MIKAVIVDLDDTLYDQALAFKKAILKFKILPDEELNRLYKAFRHHSDSVFVDAASGKMPMKDMHIYRMREGFSDLGYVLTDDEALHLQDAYAKQQGQIELIEDWKEVFSWCQEKGLAIGIITNGPLEHQWDKIRALGVLNWVAEDAVVISSQVGINKPDVAIFQMMEKRLGCHAKDMVYIGDAYENDIAGAKGAGWQAIWFNHKNNQVQHQSYQADLETSQIRTIFEWLKTNR